MLNSISLNKNGDFRRMYRRKSVVGPVLVTYFSKNRYGYNRVGITASKKIGKAYERNRARRVIREAYRLLEPLLCTDDGWDIVFVARVRTTLCPMQEVYYLMKKHLTPLLRHNNDEKGC